MTRFTAALFLLGTGVSLQAAAQTPCTGLACQQVSCPGSTTTTISGTVYAPNGIDPLPNITVYIPNAAVDPFPPNPSPAQCQAPGTPPLGSPLVGTTTGVDGKFILTNVPVGANIPLVIQSGRWRRQLVIPGTTGCADTPFDTRFPRNQSEGDIPKIAVATGSVDQVECVIRKVGVDDTEFTNPGGTGRINLFQGDGGTGRNIGSGGALIDNATPVESVLMGDSTVLGQYDVLMLPCEGGAYSRPAGQLGNLVQFANNGGRVYSSHFAYSWMVNNPPFDTVVKWNPNQSQQNSGTATVDTTFSEGRILSQWLGIVGASVAPGQMAISTIRHDFNGVNPPTQSWLTLNNALNGDPKPVMQFVFDTPVAAKTNQCGRVLFNEYHVENTGVPPGTTFPNECSTAAMTPQEKLLEFSLFELTDDGTQPTLTPVTQDFGSVPVGFGSAPQTFTFTNNSTFALIANVSPASGDFKVVSTNCGQLVGGASCTISVTFTPTALGPRTGLLSVSAGAQTITSSLTGTGVPALTSSVTSLTFGSVDVGATSSQTITLTSSAPAAIPFPGVITTGDYSATTTCGATVPALGTCTVTVTFKPTTTGSRPGTLSAAAAGTAYANLAVTLTGNGIDFTLSLSPASGSTVAGYGSSTTATITPLAGFAAPVTLSCTTNAVASTCLPVQAILTPSAAISTPITITTISKYTVIGYGGFATGLLALAAFSSTLLLFFGRKRASALARYSLAFCLLTASSFLLSGCTGKLPALNPSYTAPGDYTYTVTATDGFLVHTATYSLHVTAR